MLKTPKALKVLTLTVTRNLRTFDRQLLMGW